LREWKQFRSSYTTNGRNPRVRVGIVDEAAFYTRALTEDEIKDAMEKVLSIAVEPEGKLPITWGTITAQY
jgi:hypothetical protein